MSARVEHLSAADLQEEPARRRGLQVLGTVMLVTGLAIAAVVVATHRTQAPIGSPATAPASLTPALPPLSFTLVLPTTTIKAGGEISGQIVVDNRTGHVIRVPGCHGIFGVALTSSTYHPEVSFLGCLEMITIPVGQSRDPIIVQASYDRCGMSGPSVDTPACLPTGSPRFPPLPPGKYEATTFEAGTAVPVPAPIAVTVVP